MRQSTSFRSGWRWRTTRQPTWPSPPATVNPSGPIVESVPGGYHFGWIAQILPYPRAEATSTAHLDFNAGLYDDSNNSHGQDR